MSTRRALKTAAAVPFRRVEGLDDATSRLQRATEEATEHARRALPPRGVPLTVKMPASGNVIVPHKLGKKPENVEERKVTGASPSYFEIKRTTRFLTFTSASACTVEFWVS